MVRCSESRFSVTRRGSRLDYACSLPSHAGDREANASQMSCISAAALWSGVRLDDPFQVYFWKVTHG